jgi:hypothetical protein
METSLIDYGRARRRSTDVWMLPGQADEGRR